MRAGAALLTALAVLTSAGTAEAGLRGNPFAQGPVYTDWHFRDDARAARGDAAFTGGFPASLFTVTAAVPESKWWPLTAPGKTRSKLRAYIHTAETERTFAGHSTRVLLRGAPARALRARVFVALTDENEPKASCERNTVEGGAAFRRWVDAYAKAIGSHRAILFVAADGTGRTSCLRGKARRQKLADTRYEVRRLSRLPHAAVYVDAAFNSWLGPAQAAGLLRQEGVSAARGFAVNLTAYDWTASEIRYGQAISRRLHGKPFVVNTALNGNGPLWIRNARGRRMQLNCNPAGRALGPLPMVNPAPHVDAFFWAGRPGHSNGTCGEVRGSLRGPQSSTWWPKWAAALIRAAQKAHDFPLWRR